MTNMNTTPDQTGRNPSADIAPPLVSRRAVFGAVGAAAAVGGLAACSESGGGEETGGTDYEPGSADLQVEMGPEIDGVNYAEDYQGPRYRELEPFGDGATEFTVLTREIPEVNYATNFFTGLLEEKTGVKVTYDSVPSGDDGVTKTNAILAGGDLPDAIFIARKLFSLSQVTIYGQQGLFIPLDKLIDEYAPHVVDMFTTFPEMRTQFTSPDGRMYGLPNMNECYHCKSQNVRTWINDDWIQGVGGSMPETLDDLDALLTEFQGYANKPGNAVMSAGDSTRIIGQMNYFLGSFLETSLNNILAPGGKVTWVPSQEAYREGVIWLQEQFAKGNLDATIFSMTADQFKRLGDGEDGPAFGIVHALNPYAFASDVPPVITDDRNPASIMKVLPPLEGPSGLRTCDWDWYAFGQPSFVITSSCQDPITMIRWADYQYELGLTIAMKAGEQGPGWEFSDKGAKGIDGQQATWALIEGSETANQAWIEFGPLYKSLSQRNSQEVPQDVLTVEELLYRAGAAYEPYAIPEASKIPELAFDIDGAAQIGEFEANLESALVQGLAGFATGRADATKDADWEAFQAGFTNQGVEQYLSVYQTAYDEQV